MNLWRGILQWLGGLGIVIVALIFLPVMRVGRHAVLSQRGVRHAGKGPAAHHRHLARPAQCLYRPHPGPGRDLRGARDGRFNAAVVHALTTVSTGGFSTTDLSFAAFSGPAGIRGGGVHDLASVPFIRFIQIANGDRYALIRDVQVRA